MPKTLHFFTKFYTIPLTIFNFVAFNVVIEVNFSVKDKYVEACFYTEK